jgi:lysophospholipase L1-like esterase
MRFPRCAVAAICAAWSLAVTCSPAATPPGAMMLISRGVPAFASSGDHAANANDNDYNSTWRSARLPATLTFDLSSVDPGHRKRILLAWYNDASYSYDHAILHAPGYNNAGSYTVEANSAPGGGTPPANGWVVLATVDRNTLHSREHVLEFGNYKWIRMNFSASDGSPQNTDVAVNVDIYDAGGGTDDGWLFLGDSITAGGMSHANMGGTPADSFGNQVNALAHRTPVQENAGMPGWTAAGLQPYIHQWLQLFPGKYVTLAFGSNDAAGPMAPGVFYANMESLVKEVVAAGKVAVVPTIPWSRDTTHAANIPGLNAQLHRLYEKNHCVVPGPDLYAFFQQHPEQISSDNLHPTEAGYASLRAQWARSAAAIYAAGLPAECQGKTPGQ